VNRLAGALATLKAWWRLLIHGRSGKFPDTRGHHVVRLARITVLIITALLTLQSLLLVAGAVRDDIAIKHNMGVAEAEVLDAGPRRSTIEFVTPDRVTYRPELGVLYPSELATGMRIYVEYDKLNPNLVRVQHRNAGLAIIPAGSIAVVGWLVAAAVLAGLTWLDRRLDRQLVGGEHHHPGIAADKVRVEDASR
jgi:hypothetical protein